LHNTKELEILYETIHDLTSTLSIREVIQRLLQRVLIHLESEIASILLMEPDGKLKIRHAQGLPIEVVETTRVESGKGISGYVYESGKELLIEDVEKDTRFKRQNHERYYTNSAISAPLQVQGRVLGVINVNNKKNHKSFSKEDLRLIGAIAGQAAVALNNAKLYEETLELAKRDSLTGLANHGHFWATLATEIDRANRYDREFSLVMIDIDHFKAYNDRNGHIAGDEALVQVAKQIEKSSRNHDFAARYGGEEFAIILPETGKAGGIVVAEKLRKSISAQAFTGEEGGTLTVSAGVSTFPHDANSAASLVEAADSRLYIAKARGRNLVCASHQEVPV
jgi:diguanylate cyclase (GGDEF)-like protein